MIKFDESTFNACHGGNKEISRFHFFKNGNVNISKNLTKYTGCS
jgi:hypothetical protein